MDIVFATDNDYLRHLAVAVVSLLKNNSDMDIYVLNSDVSIGDWEKLKELFIGKNSNLINCKIDISQIGNLVTHSHFTKANYYRLFIPEIVKGDKALYLDADIVVNQPIINLYNTDISNTFLAAVDNPEILKHQDLDMHPEAKYFNSGVMLINLEKWRTYKIKEKVINFIKNNSEVIQFVDQDGLNSVINGNWLELHPKYNMHTVLLGASYSSNSIIKEAIANPVIIHYTGSSKPWHLGNIHPYKHLYWKYLRMTPYKYTLPSKPLSVLSLDFIKAIVPKPIKERVKQYCKAIFR